MSFVKDGGGGGGRGKDVFNFKNYGAGFVK